MLKLKLKQKIKKQSAVPCLAFMLVLVLSSFGSMNLHAQQEISGTVTDVGGVPLPGVNVVQKGTSKGALTDFDGKFTIQLDPSGKTLVFSYIGFKTKEVAVGNKTTFAIALEKRTEDLDEVIVIGYSPIEREKVLGAVSSVKAEDIEQSTPVEALEGIQGRLAGVQILSNNGPGEGFDVRIRGVSTFGSGTDPLYVVDGQQLEDIDNLNPADIASLEVVKDAATAAIYGSRAANGVIIITTKKGKAGELDLTVTHNMGVNSLVGDLPVANSAQRLLYERIGQGNDRQGTDSLSLLNRNSYDLQELVTRRAVRQQTNVAISGGSEKAKYYWNTGFMDERGIVINSGYKRLNTTMSLDVDVTKKLKVGTNVRLSFEEQNGIQGSRVLRQIAERLPYYPLFEPNGDLTPTLFGRQNPIAQAKFRTQDNRNFRAQIFNYVELDILPNLKVKSTLGVNFRFNKRENFEPGILIGNDGTGNSNGSLRNFLIYDIQQENFINYKNKWGKHSLSAVGGMQIQKYVREFENIAAADFANDLIRTFNNAAAGAITSNNTSHRRNNLYSLFAGFDYDFDNKYLIGATIRRDGSSRFGDNFEFGNFPAVKLGWRVSEEDFLKNSNLINDLKFRATWGVSGNERIGDYLFTGAIEPGFNYNGLTGFAPTRLGNADVTWEETASTNIGFDLTMLDRRLEINADVWEKKTTGLLAGTPLPEESGYSGIIKNVGAVNNRGIDFSITGTILKSKDFSWRSNFNIGILQNEVTKLDGGTPFDVGSYRIEEGQPIGNIFGYKNLGVYRYDESNAYNPEGERLTPNFDNAGEFVNYTLNGSVYTGDIEQIKVGNQIPQGGDIIWEDLDNNFSIDVDDRQILGNGLSTVYGGFSHDISYKNFSVSMLFDFNFGQDIYRLYDELRNDFNSANETPGPDRILGSWREQGDVTEYPRLSRVGQNRLRANSYFVTDGAYIKWRYLRFNYKLPKSIMDNLKGVKDISLSLAVNNVLTWTNYIGYNPEIGNRGSGLTPNTDLLRYPNDRELILAVKVQF
jgi:TonB-linked SusC/RagA family outer membrane protein